MNIELKDLIELLSVKTKKEKHPLVIGENYFIRTVTMYYTGHLKEICGRWLVLESASWICDTGRFHDFLKDGNCSEYESFIDVVFVPIDSIIDVTRWKHNLFSGQK